MRSMKRDESTMTVWMSDYDIRTLIYLCICQVESMLMLAALVCTPAGSCIVAGGD
jgi:hypothetical protein